MKIITKKQEQAREEEITALNKEIERLKAKTKSGRIIKRKDIPKEDKP